MFVRNWMKMSGQRADSKTLAQEVIKYWRERDLHDSMGTAETAEEVNYVLGDATIRHWLHENGWKWMSHKKGVYKTDTTGLMLLSTDRIHLFLFLTASNTA